jgi:hypothetical protein
MTHGEKNKKNEYSHPDLIKTMINVTMEVSDTPIKNLKEDILEAITNKFKNKLDIVNQNVQDALK